MTINDLIFLLGAKEVQIAELRAEVERLQKEQAAPPSANGDEASTEESESVAGA